MITALQIELFKIFNRRRSYIGFLAVLALVLLLLVFFKSEGETLFGFVSQNLRETFVMQGNLVNGNLYGYLVLKSLIVHFPVLIALVTGDLVSGERQAGTLRLVLTRPLPRTAFISAKFISSMIYSSLLVLFMGIVSIGLGYILFGRGDLMVLMSSVHIFEQSDIMWRFAMAYAYGMLGMAAVSALAVFLSTILESTVSAILWTIAVVLIANFVTTFDVSGLSVLTPLLFTTHINQWQGFFMYDFPNSQIIIGAFVLLLHIVIFYVLAILIFNKRDILS